MFSAITVTQNFLGLVGNRFYERYPWMFLGAPKKEKNKEEIKN